MSKHFYCWKQSPEVSVLWKFTQNCHRCWLIINNGMIQFETLCWIKTWLPGTSFAIVNSCSPASFLVSSATNCTVFVFGTILTQEVWLLIQPLSLILRRRTTSASLSVSNITNQLHNKLFPVLQRCQLFFTTMTSLCVEEDEAVDYGSLQWQCNYWFHKKSCFEHTHIFMDASATGQLEWCTTVCSLVLIAISLFLFIIFVNVVLSWGVVCGLRLFKCL